MSPPPKKIGLDIKTDDATRSPEGTKRVALITEVLGRAGPRDVRDGGEAPALCVHTGWGVDLGRGPRRGQELVRPESPASAKEEHPGFLTSFPRCGGHREEGGRKLKHCQ